MLYAVIKRTKENNIAVNIKQMRGNIPLIFTFNTIAKNIKKL